MNVLMEQVASSTDGAEPVFHSDCHLGQTVMLEYWDIDDFIRFEEININRPFFQNPAADFDIPEPSLVHEFNGSAGLFRCILYSASQITPAWIVAGIIHHLDFYPPEDLAVIVKRSSGVLEIELDGDGAAVMSRRARGTPRVVNRLLKRVRDYAQVRAKGKIDANVATEALERMGIDEKGLDPLDKRFLYAIIQKYEGGPVGLETLAATLCEEVDILTDIIEPYLLKIGYLQRSPRGRLATRGAYNHLGIDPNKPGENQGNLF